MCEYSQLCALPVVLLFFLSNVHFCTVPQMEKGRTKITHMEKHH